MDTIECPRCKIILPANQKFCPNCGGLLNAQENPSGFGSIIVGILITGTIALILFGIYKSTNELSIPLGNTIPREETISKEAILMAQHFMKEKLKAPSTADFQSTREANYQLDTGTGEELHIVTSYVDSENSFGATLRTHFAITMRRDGKTYYLVEIHTW